MNEYAYQSGKHGGEHNCKQEAPPINISAEHNNVYLGNFNHDAVKTHAATQTHEDTCQGEENILSVNVGGNLFIFLWLLIRQVF